MMDTATPKTANVCVVLVMKARTVKTSARDGTLVRSVDRDASVTLNTVMLVGQRTGSVSVIPIGMV